MYNIALSLKFKQLYHDIADKIFCQLPTKNNNFTIFTHLRFGDYHKKNDFITRCNQEMINNLSNYFECHKTKNVQFYNLKQDALGTALQEPIEVKLYIKF